MNKNCLLCGVGGQGVVLASKLIAYAAMDKGMDVRTSETIGMAQRGGSVVSHVRMGRDIHSPMIPKGCADVIMAFEPAEAVRCLPYLKEGGVAVVNRKAVQPVTATLGGGGYDGEEMIAYLERYVSQLYVLDIQMEDMRTELARRVKPQFAEMNLLALELGAAAAQARDYEER